MPAAAATIGGVREEKDALRREMRARRDQIPSGERAALSRAATERILSHPALGRGGLAGLFWSAKGEIDTAPLAGALWNRGQRLAFPRVESGQIVFLETPGPDALVPGGFGLCEPRADLPMAALTEIGFLLVPGLAFGQDGSRLGYGKGFYDRALGRLSPQAVTVGFCFDFQLLPRVPCGPTDLPVGEVVTDRRHVRREGTS